jgi:hypothetical protein
MPTFEEWPTSHGNITSVVMKRLVYEVPKGLGACYSTRCATWSKRYSFLDSMICVTYVVIPAPYCDSCSLLGHLHDRARHILERIPVIVPQARIHRYTLELKNVHTAEVYLTVEVHV